MNYIELTELENLFQAWNEFKKGKRKKQDVQVFERNLEDNLFELHKKLKDKSYRHGGYEAFFVNDPKRRHIHKASVSDRIIHHLLYKYLYKLYDKTFIYDSYSCRVYKGTHKGVKRLKKLTRKVSKNYTRECFALKCDIKKFFASVDHKILISLLERRIKDKDILSILSEIIKSFNYEEGKGIPLGNLTSQVFANIYMDELDQFVKHRLRVKYYLRYADDFIFLSDKKDHLVKFIDPLSEFLRQNLNLELHSKKIIFRKLNWGIDFLGYVILPYYILPRTKTKRRMLRKLKEKINDLNFNQSLQSYLGYLSHANSYKLTMQLHHGFPPKNVLGLTGIPKTRISK